MFVVRNLSAIVFVFLMVSEGAAVEHVTCKNGASSCSGSSSLGQAVTRQFNGRCEPKADRGTVCPDSTMPVKMTCSAPSKNVTCTKSTYNFCSPNAYRFCQCTNWAAKRNTAKATVYCD